MAYTNAIFFVDYEGGSDAARTALTTCVISNPSGSIIQVAKVAHGLVVGAIVDATLFTAWFNDAWKVSVVVDADNFQVEGTWQAAADANGTITPRGGSSKADAWKTWTSGATAARIQPGDTIRTMASPDPTSLGVTGAWTDGPLAATQAITSSTNATPIVVTRASHGRANGDTVVIAGHTTNTNANGTWKLANVATNTYELEGSVGNGVGGATGTSRKVNNCVVTLSAAVNKNIALPVDGGTGNQGTKTNWTASANVTCTVTTADFKQGGECQSIDIAAGFTTGLAAYLTLPLVTDFSAYQQVTFWIKQTAGTIGAAGAVRLRLCTDTVGAVPVHDLNVPALGALNQWFPVKVDVGGALSALINSISFDVVTDNGAQTFRVDNVFAVKSLASADSLSLQSLIGKNTAGESWLAVQSVVGARVMLDQVVNTAPGAAPQRGYTGATETVTTYKREPLLVPPAAAATTAPSDFSFTENGSGLTTSMTYSAGWDRTAMTSQSGETWLSGQNGNGVALGNNSGRIWIDLDGVFGLSRFNNAYFVGSNSAEMGLGNIHANNNTCTTNLSAINLSSVNEFYAGGSRFRGNIGSARNNGGNGFGISADQNRFGSINGAHGNTAAGIRFGSGANTTVESANAQNNGTSGILFNNQSNSANDNLIKSLTTAGNATAGVSNTTGGLNYLKNAVIGESTEVAVNIIGGRVVSENHDGVAGNTQVFTSWGRMSSELTVRHTASGVAWAMANTAGYDADTGRFVEEVARVACAANSLVTFKLWMRRTNTGLTFRLMCKGGQIAGVANDVSSAMTAAADTWEQVSISFTPTETGAVTLTVEAAGGTTYIGYFDDLTVTQA